jgi:hypothetical protein
MKGDCFQQCLFNMTDGLCHCAFTTAGGCQYQHMSIAAQREWKQQQVVDVLTRIGGFTGVTTGDKPEAAESDSPQQWRVNPVVGTAEVYGECSMSAAALHQCVHSLLLQASVCYLRYKRHLGY